MLLFYGILSTLLIVVCLTLYALPATLSLKRGRRPGLSQLTIPDAVDQLRNSGVEGLELVEASRALVAHRMAYCRRNSFDFYSKAFDRGYGYCQQQAYALEKILTLLGFKAKVVHAFRNRLPDGKIVAHAWVRVEVEDQVRDVDSIAYDQPARVISFIPLSRVHIYSTVFRMLAGWGCTFVNAHRYYRTRSDTA